MCRLPQAPLAQPSAPASLVRSVQAEHPQAGTPFGTVAKPAPAQDSMRFTPCSQPALHSSTKVAADPAAAPKPPLAAVPAAKPPLAAEAGPSRLVGATRDASPSHLAASLSTHAAPAAAAASGTPATVNRPPQPSDAGPAPMEVQTAAAGGAAAAAAPNGVLDALYSSSDFDEDGVPGQGEEALEDDPMQVEDAVEEAGEQEGAGGAQQAAAAEVAAAGAAAISSCAQIVQRVKAILAPPSDGPSGSASNGGAGTVAATRLAGRELAGLWSRELGELIERCAMPNTIIGVIGDTGCGKSSTLNALLGEEDVLPTSGMRACTSCVVEVSYIPSGVYQAR